MKTNIESLAVSQKLAALPQFVHEDHPKFVEFLKAYYLWSAEQGPDLAMEALKLSNDVDLVPDELLSLYRDSYARNIPKDITADFRLFAKHLREFYRIRGTEESFRILFRAMGIEDIKFEYPKDRLFKPSDAVWNTKTFVLVDSDVSDLKFTRVEGSVSFDIDSVEKEGSNWKVEVSNVEGDLSTLQVIGTANVVKQYKLDSIESDGVWNDGDEITIGGMTFRVDKVIYGKVKRLEVVSGGSGYQVDELITIETDGLGSGFQGKISEVDRSGSIRKAVVTRSGFGYTKPSPEIKIDSRGSGAVLKIHWNEDFRKIKAATIMKNEAASSDVKKTTNGVTFNLSKATYHQNGFWEDDRQKPSHDHIHIHDSDYYQEYSYVIKTKVRVEETEAIRSLLHVAGTKMFIRRG